MRIVAYEDENFRFEYKIYRGDIFLHCIVFNWTLSNLKFGKKVFEEFKEKRRKEGYEFIYTVSPNPKFCKLLGGEKINSIEKKGKTYEVFRWVLK